MVFLHALTQSKYSFISAREVGLSLSDYLLIRALGLPRREELQLFFLTVPEQGSPYKCQITPGFVPANFASGLSASLAQILVPSHIPAHPLRICPQETAGVRPWSLETLLTRMWGFAVSWALPRLHSGESDSGWGRAVGLQASPYTLRTFLGGGDC